MSDEQADVMKELESQWTPEMGNAGTNATKAGNAVLKCNNAFLNRAATSGRKQLVAQGEILQHQADPSAVGKKAPPIRFGIETVEDLKRLNTALVNLQIDPVKSPQDLIRVTRELQGVVFNAAIAENKDAQFPPNVYINAGARRRDLEGVGAAAGTATAGRL